MRNLGPRSVVLVLALVVGACGGTAGPTATPAPPTAPTATGIAATPSAQPTARADYVIVAVGDSIPYNSPDDCPGCTGFVDQYAEALAFAVNKSVVVLNLSEHTGLTVEELLEDLTRNQGRIDALADADVVIVGIAHNDVPMSRDDDACDGVANERPDWSKYTDACIAVEVARFTPIYEAVYARIADLRAGDPTIMLTINRYNDWIGWPDNPPAAEGIAATARVIAAWNAMICAAAEASNFTCADISTAFNGPDGTEPSGDLLALDYTHPSQDGNDLIAEILLDLGFAPLVIGP